MVTIEKTVVIERPQEEVFDFANNPANAPRWQNGIKSKRWTSDGPSGVGSKQHVVARWLGRDVETTNEYTIWDPPNQSRFKTSSGPLRLEEGMRLEADGDSTRLTWDMQMEATGIFKPVEILVKIQAEKTSATYLAALKRLLESGSD